MQPVATQQVVTIQTIMLRMMAFENFFASLSKNKELIAKLIGNLLKCEF